MVNGAFAIVIGYLLGSIPSAYLATRIAKDIDIRQLGGGNIGGLNVYREVGKIPAALAVTADFGKGAAAVAIAFWLLQVDVIFVLLAGMASVIGHNWMVFLKFNGGKGMGTTFGALFVLLPIYDYPLGLAILFGILLIPFLITRNIALAMGIGLLSLPFIAWLGMDSGIGIIMAVATGLIIALKFLPTARAALAKSEGKKDFIFDNWQREENKE
jgi:glycerol-3-phosphate acyltransferase PlsY